MLFDILQTITDFVVLLTRLTTEDLADEQRMALIDKFIRKLSAIVILLANSGVRRKGAGNFRQTSVCRRFPPFVHCRKPRQTEVCRTFWNSPTVSIVHDFLEQSCTVAESVRQNASTKSCLRSV